MTLSLDDVRAVVAAAEKDFPDAGWRLRTRDRAAAGAENFVERLGYFMTLVGLTALIIGGAGIANAVSAFVNRRTGTIATLKCLGAPSRTVFGIYLTEILIVAVLAIAIGARRRRACSASGAVLLARHPSPADLQSHRTHTAPDRRGLRLPRDDRLCAVAARAHAPGSGIGTVPASHRACHRLAVARSTWPRLRVALALIALLVFMNFDDRRVTLIYLGGLAGSFVILLGLAYAIVRLAEIMPKPQIGDPALCHFQSLPARRLRPIGDPGAWSRADALRDAGLDRSHHRFRTCSRACPSERRPFSFSMCAMTNCRPSSTR